MVVVAYAIVNVNTKITAATIQDPTTTLTTMIASTTDTLATAVKRMWFSMMSLICCTVTLTLILKNYRVKYSVRS